MPHTDLPSYRDGFFEKFLADLPGTPTFQTLQGQQPAGQPLVLMGDYIEYTGNALTPLPNATLTPRFAIRAGEGTPQTFVMLWIVERFDVATDTAATIARILADFRPPMVSGQADADNLSSELATTWSKALTTDAVRQALARNLSTITQVPDGLPTHDLEELRSFLRHFGTYKPDGTYYAKGPVAEGSFPAGVSTPYLAPDTGNVAEVRLPRDCFYCYALVPERLWSPQAEATRFRQLIYRIEDRGADAGAARWRLALLHTVSAAAGGAAPAARFIFFFAGVGLGLAVPAGATSALAPSTAALVEDLSDTSTLAAAIADPQTPVVGTTDAPIVLLIGAVKAGFPTSPLPDGVIQDGDGAIRTFRCPPQHVMTLAARTDVENLVLSTPVWVDMTQALAKMNAAGRVFPAGITSANAGQGVVVGIVDSGIDGGHPAFLGRQDDATKSRIHSVWHMSESGGDSPWKRASDATKDAYRSMNFGKEYIGESEVTTTTNYSSDGHGGFTPGHGTHVAGIAAGRAFGTWPGGVAPGATIVVAALGTIGGYINDVVAGVKYLLPEGDAAGAAVRRQYQHGDRAPRARRHRSAVDRAHPAREPGRRAGREPAEHRQYHAALPARPDHLRVSGKSARVRPALAGDHPRRRRSLDDVSALRPRGAIGGRIGRRDFLGLQRRCDHGAAPGLDPALVERGAGDGRGAADVVQPPHHDQLPRRLAGQHPQRARGAEQPPLQSGGVLDSAGAGRAGRQRPLDHPAAQRRPRAVHRARVRRLP